MYSRPQEIDYMYLFDINANVYRFLVNKKYTPIKILEKIYKKANDTYVFDNIVIHTNCNCELANIMMNDKKIDAVTQNIIRNVFELY